jgi:serine/threonine-protein kinase
MRTEQPPTPRPPLQPTPFGRYTLLHPLQRGSTGELFLARLGGAEGFEKLCVIKRLLPQLAGDADFVTRFIDEARVLTRLNHGSIAQVLDLGLHEGAPYLALEFVDGKDLRQVAARARERQRPLPLAFVLQVMGRVLDALAYAHRKKDDQEQGLQLVHRDVSPPNVLVSYEGEVKVVDFGLAHSRMSAAVTLPHVLLGRFQYLSPEQACHQRADRRSDLYAVGLCLWELVAGRSPFDGVPATELLDRVAQGDVPPLSMAAPGCPGPVASMVERALTVDPAGRFQTAEEFRAELMACLMREDPAAGPERLAALMRRLFVEEYQAERQLLAAARSAVRGPPPSGIARPSLTPAPSPTPAPASTPLPAPDAHGPPAGAARSASLGAPPGLLSRGTPAPIGLGMVGGSPPRLTPPAGTSGLGTPAPGALTPPSVPSLVTPPPVPRAALEAAPEEVGEADFDMDVVTDVHARRALQASQAPATPVPLPAPSLPAPLADAPPSPVQVQVGGAAAGLGKGGASIPVLTPASVASAGGPFAAAAAAAEARASVQPAAPRVRDVERSHAREVVDVRRVVRSARAQRGHAGAAGPRDHITERYLRPAQPLWRRPRVRRTVGWGLGVLLLAGSTLGLLQWAALLAAPPAAVPPPSAPQGAPAARLPAAGAAAPLAAPAEVAPAVARVSPSAALASGLLAPLVPEPRGARPAADSRPAGDGPIDMRAALARARARAAAEAPPAAVPAVGAASPLAVRPASGSAGGAGKGPVPAVAAGAPRTAPPGALPPPSPAASPPPAGSAPASPPAPAPSAAGTPTTAVSPSAVATPSPAPASGAATPAAQTVAASDGEALARAWAGVDARARRLRAATGCSGEPSAALCHRHASLQARVAAGGGGDLLLAAVEALGRELDAALAAQGR